MKRKKAEKQKEEKRKICRIFDPRHFKKRKKIIFIPTTQSILQSIAADEAIPSLDFPQNYIQNA